MYDAFTDKIIILLTINKYEWIRFKSRLIYVQERAKKIMMDISQQVRTLMYHSAAILCMVYNAITIFCRCTIYSCVVMIAKTSEVSNYIRQYFILYMTPR